MSMSDLVPVVEVPRSRGAWCRWAEVQIEQLDFGRESELLRVLAGRVSAGGTAEIGVELLMRKLNRSRSTVLEHLRKLRARGVLRTRQRGPGRVPVHELLAEPVERQLSLFEDVDDVGRGQQAASAEPPVQVSAAAVSSSPPAADTGRAPAAPPAPACRPADRAKGSDQLDPAVNRAVTATAVCADARAISRPPVTSPSLPVVLDVLAEAGGALNVEDGPVDKALRHFPERPDSAVDHRRAAGFVVTQALEPDCRVRAAGILLWRELERQSSPPPVGGACAPGRRRPAAPEPSVTRSPAGRRWVVTDNKYDRAAGLTELAT